MVTFGRRLPAAPHRAPVRATSLDLAGLARSVGVLLLVLISGAVFYHDLTDRSWLETSPWDLVPGSTYNIGGFEAPEGCAPGGWARGDYIPRACVAGHRFADPARYGLVRPPEKRHPPLRYFWIDSGPDALLLACPMWGACEVLRVAEGRFYQSETAPPRTPAAEATARRMPWSSITALFADIGIKVMMVAVMAFIVLRHLVYLAMGRAPPSPPQ